VDLSSRAAKTSTNIDLENFQAWQLGQRGDGKEQKGFREDAMLYPNLLVFAIM
jgi:hypothetical protein